MTLNILYFDLGLSYLDGATLYLLAILSVLKLLGGGREFNLFYVATFLHLDEILHQSRAILVNIGHVPILLEFAVITLGLS